MTTPRGMGITRVMDQLLKPIRHSMIPMHSLITEEDTTMAARALKVEIEPIPTTRLLRQDLVIHTKGARHSFVLCDLTLVAHIALATSKKIGMGRLGNPLNLLSLFQPKNLADREMNYLGITTF